jgi:hypothetical protein
MSIIEQTGRQFLDGLRLASPIASMSYWLFELSDAAKARGVPAPLFAEAEAFFRAGLSPEQVVARLAKRWGL